jgi:hypothetical protein
MRAEVFLDISMNAIAGQFAGAERAIFQFTSYLILES